MADAKDGREYALTLNWFTILDERVMEGEDSGESCANRKELSARDWQALEVQCEKAVVMVGDAPIERIFRLPLISRNSLSYSR